VALFSTNENACAVGYADRIAKNSGRENPCSDVLFGESISDQRLLP
jgi:hypothetical protein